MVKPTPNASYSLAITLSYPNQVGMLATITSAIAQAGGSLGNIVLQQQTQRFMERELIIEAYSEEHAHSILEALRALPKVEIEKVVDRTLELHRQGKIHINSRFPVTSQSDLAMAYTPGVGRISRAIAQNPEQVFSFTIKGNTVAVVSDGSAVLGLGNLGAAGALPVMEGKAMLFKQFAGVDAFPICLDTQDSEAIIATVKHLAPVFGGINLEDISAPRCFEIERRLSEELAIPVFHDDQHGTAIVVTAAIFNALKLVNKSLAGVKIVINGSGAAGIAIARLLIRAGATVGNLILCDSQGIISQNRSDLTPEKQEFTVNQTGSLADAMPKADIFIGVSVPNILSPEMVNTMAREPIIMAMSNPIPEIQPELISQQVAVCATGRSDYPNQINNVLAFPGILRGALQCRATAITQQMCLEAASAIASLIPSSELTANFIIPSVFDEQVVPTVAKAVQNAAQQENVARE